MVRCALLFFAILTVNAAFAQTAPALSTKSKKAIELYTVADNFRVRGEYDQAINLLNQAIAKDPKFTEAYLRLGITYFSMKQYANALRQFEKGLSLTDDLNKQKAFWFAMGEPYLLTGDYEKAMKVLSSFIANERSGKQRLDRANLLYKSAEFALENKKHPNPYSSKPLSDSVNEFELQYFPVLTADQSQLIYTRRVSNDPNDDENLVVSRKGPNGRWLRGESISRNINTPLNEGTCSISADGRKLILTTCTGRDGIGSCDLYESVKIGNDWSEPRNLGRNVNSSAWESQPSLSADGRTLYFVSDRKSGLGLRDIWVSTLDASGNWTKAVNAGPQVNSSYDEISPFIHANNRTLFFATNGRPGFGGYDIFYCDTDTAGWTVPRNLGPPINDNGEQFSLFITADGKKGYYSHEEVLQSGQSRSKIYEVFIPPANQVRFRSNYVKGVIRDKVSRAPLRAQIELLNIKTDEVVSLVSSDSVSGEYLMVLTQGDEYALYVTKAGYLFKSYNFNYSEITDFEPITIDIDLEKMMAGSVAVLNNIFFDVDKFELKEKSSPELQKILRFLKENPSVRVEIGGHTDNSGSASHNRELSEKRARSVYDFLVQHGIDRTRLEPKGYGPDRPISPNDTEEGRQQNRRIEFRILH
jgi:outer membrane protein OmpA-like peptidoglycan-associated protein/tetratricopeptide (TPR) repeat protein